MWDRNKLNADIRIKMHENKDLPMLEQRVIINESKLLLSTISENPIKSELPSELNNISSVKKFFNDTQKVKHQKIAKA
jgi:hypothetical protein